MDPNPELSNQDEALSSAMATFCDLEDTPSDSLSYVFVAIRRDYEVQSIPEDHTTEETFMSENSVAQRKHCGMSEVSSKTSEGSSITRSPIAQIHRSPVTDDDTSLVEKRCTRNLVLDDDEGNILYPRIGSKNKDNTENNKEDIIKNDSGDEEKSLKIRSFTICQQNVVKLEEETNNLQNIPFQDGASLNENHSRLKNDPTIDSFVSDNSVSHYTNTSTSHMTTKKHQHKTVSPTPMNKIQSNRVIEDTAPHVDKNNIINLSLYKAEPVDSNAESCNDELTENNKKISAEGNKLNMEQSFINETSTTSKLNVVSSEKGNFDCQNTQSSKNVRCNEEQSGLDDGPNDKNVVPVNSSSLCSDGVSREIRPNEHYDSSVSPALMNEIQSTLFNEDTALHVDQSNIIYRPLCKGELSDTDTGSYNSKRNVTNNSAEDNNAGLKQILMIETSIPSEENVVHSEEQNLHFKNTETYDDDGSNGKQSVLEEDPNDQNVVPVNSCSSCTDSVSSGIPPKEPYTRPVSPTSLQETQINIFIEDAEALVKNNITINRQLCREEPPHINTDFCNDERTENNNRHPVEDNKIDLEPILITENSTSIKQNIDSSKEQSRDRENTQSCKEVWCKQNQSKFDDDPTNENVLPESSASLCTGSAITETPLKEVQDEAVSPTTIAEAAHNSVIDVEQRSLVEKNNTTNGDLSNEELGHNKTGSDNNESTGNNDRACAKDINRDSIVELFEIKNPINHQESFKTESSRPKIRPTNKNNGGNDDVDIEKCICIQSAKTIDSEERNLNCANARSVNGSDCCNERFVSQNLPNQQCTLGENIFLRNGDDEAIKTLVTDTADFSVSQRSIADPVIEDAITISKTSNISNQPVPENATDTTGSHPEENTTFNGGAVEETLYTEDSTNNHGKVLNWANLNLDIANIIIQTSLKCKNEQPQRENHPTLRTLVPSNAICEYEEGQANKDLVADNFTTTLKQIIEFENKTKAYREKRMKLLASVADVGYPGETQFTDEKSIMLDNSFPEMRGIESNICDTAEEQTPVSLHGKAVMKAQICLDGNSMKQTSLERRNVNCLKEGLLVQGHDLIQSNRVFHGNCNDSQRNFPKELKKVVVDNISSINGQTPFHYATSLEESGILRLIELQMVSPCDCQFNQHDSREELNKLIPQDVIGTEQECRKNENISVEFRVEKKDKNMKDADALLSHSKCQVVIFDALSSSKANLFGDEYLKVKRKQLRAIALILSKYLDKLLENHEKNYHGICLLMSDVKCMFRNKDNLAANKRLFDYLEENIHLVMLGNINLKDIYAKSHKNAFPCNFPFYRHEDIIDEIYEFTDEDYARQYLVCICSYHQGDLTHFTCDPFRFPLTFTSPTKFGAPYIQHIEQNDVDLVSILTCPYLVDLVEISISIEKLSSKISVEFVPTPNSACFLRLLAISCNWTVSISNQADLTLKTYEPNAFSSKGSKGVEKSNEEAESFTILGTGYMSDIKSPTNSNINNEPAVVHANFIMKME